MLLLCYLFSLSITKKNRKLKRDNFAISNKKMKFLKARANESAGSSGGAVGVLASSTSIADLNLMHALWISYASEVDKYSIIINK